MGLQRPGSLPSNSARAALCPSRSAFAEPCNATAFIAPALVPETPLTWIQSSGVADQHPPGERTVRTAALQERYWPAFQGFLKTTICPVPSLDKVHT